eukprot:107259_1
MEELIAFSRQVDLLNDEEYQQCVLLFLQKCITSFSKKTTFNILFNAFLCEINNNITKNVSKMNDIITEIVANRNKVSAELEKETQVNCLALDHLPSPILGEIGSYLPFDRKIILEKCNRALFIGIRSSKLLIQTLTEIQFTKLVTFCHQNTEINLPKYGCYKIIIINAKNADADMDDSWDDDMDHNTHMVKYNFNDFDLFKHVEEIEILNCNLTFLQHLKKCENLLNVKTIRIYTEQNDFNNFFIFLSSFINEKLLNLQ